MMKKGRKGVMDSIPSSSSPYFDGGEAKARFKHQILLQDYNELIKEAEAKKMKLQYIVQRKQKLMAEVKYLRRKYKSFTRNQSSRTLCLPKLLPKKMPLPVAHQLQLPQQHGTQINSNLQTFDRNQRANKAEIPFDLNEISIPNAEEMEREPVPIFKETVQRDRNVPIFKDGSKGSSQTGKRKISWQDPVALRV